MSLTSLELEVMKNNRVSPAVRTKSMKVKSASEAATPLKRPSRRSLPVKNHTNGSFPDSDGNAGSIILSSDEEVLNVSRKRSRRSVRKMREHRTTSASPTKGRNRQAEGTNSSEDEEDIDNHSEDLNYEDSGRRAVSDDANSEDAKYTNMENHSKKKTRGRLNTSTSPAKRPSRRTTIPVNYNDAFEKEKRSDDELDEASRHGRHSAEYDREDNGAANRKISRLKAAPKSRKAYASPGKETRQQVGIIVDDSDGDDLVEDGLKSDEDERKANDSPSSKHVKRPLDGKTWSDKEIKKTEQNKERSGEERSDTDNDAENVDNNYALPGTRKRTRVSRSINDQRGSKRFKTGTFNTSESKEDQKSDGQDIESEEENLGDVDPVDEGVEPVVDENLEQVGGDSIETEILEDLNYNSGDDVTPDSAEAALIAIGDSGHSIDNAADAMGYASPRIQDLKSCPPDCQCPPTQVWYGCRKCSRIFERPESLIAHRREVHENPTEVEESFGSDKEDEIEPEPVIDSTGSPNPAVKRKHAVSDADEDSDGSTVSFSPRKRVAIDSSRASAIEVLDGDELHEVLIEDSE